MARSAYHTHVVHVVLAAELCAQTYLLAYLLYLGLPFQIAEAAAALVARGGQLVEISGRGLLDGRQTHLGRRAADADRKVVGRTCRRTQIGNVLADELRERLLVQKGFGLLIEEGLVGRAAALGNEQKLVLHARMTAVDVDLRGQVCARIFLVGHGKGHYLRVAQIAILVGLVYAARDALGIVGTRVYVLALVTDADRRTGVLACGQLALGRDALVEQHGVGDEFVVVGGFGIFEDVGEFLQVRCAQIERHVGVCLLGQQFETLGVDLQYFTAVALDDLHVVLRQKPVFGLVRLDRKRLLIDEICHFYFSFSACSAFAARRARSTGASSVPIPR